MEPRRAAAGFVDGGDAGFEAGLPGGVEEGGGLGAKLGVGRIQGVEAQQAAQMKNARLAAGEIQPRAIPQGIGAAKMKAGAHSGGRFNHGVGAGGSARARWRQEGGRQSCGACTSSRMRRPAGSRPSRPAPAKERGPSSGPDWRGG